MGNYTGISKTKMKDGSTAIMVRFTYQGIRYPVKNFTKLFGITTEKDGDTQLAKVKSMLSEGKNPFVSSGSTLSELFDEKWKTNKKNGDWGETTLRNYQYFFNKHLRHIIGMKKIEKIKYEDVEKIYDSYDKKQIATKNTIIDLLKPIFKQQMERGNLHTNIMDKEKFIKKRYSSKKEKLSKRSKTKHEDIIRNLYNSIKYYDDEVARGDNIEQHQMFLMMVVMTSHRTGEITQLEKKHCDFERRMIISPKEITKSDEDYHFPIPDECYEYFKNAPEGKLFKTPSGRGSTHRVFKRLVHLSGIETISNYNVSAHDTRRIQLYVMINKLGIDSRLADYCLDHKQIGVISHYLEFTYEDKEKAYKRYWDFIRNKSNSDETIVEEEKPLEMTEKPTNSKSNYEKLERLVDMLEKNYITKEQFEYERDNLY